MPRIDASALQLQDRAIHIGRVAKVVKGGKRFHFNAIIVAGDGQGHVGVGLGKSKEVPDAIRKGIDRAKKGLLKVPLREGTIPFAIKAHFSSTTVVLRPAAPGTGVIAGSAVRAILELAGVKNVLSKVIGSTNPHNVTKATMKALDMLRRIEHRASLRKGNS